MNYSINIRNNINELNKVVNFIEKISTAYSLDKKSTYELNLIVEELVSNTFNYGENIDASMDITINITTNLLDNQIVIVYTDNAQEFNPIKKNNSNRPTKISLDKLMVGGVGLQLVFNYSSKVSYKREKDTNIITIIKNI